MSLIDETMKTEFNLYPVEDTLESFLMQPNNTTGASFKQYIVNKAFNGRPKNITDKFNYLLNTSYGFCVKLGNFLNFIYKHESTEIINTYITPINIQIPNLAFISNQLVTYMKDGSSRLFPGFYNKPSIIIYCINNELYILNHVCKYVDEVPTYIYYAQHFLDPNYNPTLQPVPTQIKQPEYKIIEYVSGVRPTIFELFAAMNPFFKPTTSKPQANIITATENHQRHHNISNDIEIQEEFKTLITKEELKSVTRKAREYDDLKIQFDEMKKTNSILEDRVHQADTEVGLFERLYTDLQNREANYTEKIQNIEEQNRNLIKYQVLYTENQQFIQRGRDFQGYDTTLNKIINNQEETITKLNTDLSKQEETIAKLNADFTREIEERNTTIRNDTKIKEDFSSTIKSLESQVSQLTQEKQRQLENIQNLQTELQSRNSTIQQNFDKIKALTISNSQYENTIIDLKDRITTLDANNTILQIRVQNYHQENQTLKTELSTIRTKLVNLEISENIFSTQNTQLQSEIQRFKLQFDQNNVLLAQREKAYNELNATLQPLLADIQRLNEENNINKNEVARLRIETQTQSQRLVELTPDNIVAFNKQNEFISDIIKKYAKKQYDKDVKLFSTMITYNNNYYIIRSDNQLYSLDDVSTFKISQLTTLP